MVSPQSPTADSLKLDGIAAYSRQDLPAALTAFTAALKLSPTRADVAANISATLFELGRYTSAAAASAHAKTLANTAKDDRRAALCESRQEKAEALAALASTYAASRTRPGPEALPPLTRPPSAPGFSFYPLGHEASTSFLTDRDALVDQLSGTPSVAVVNPLWLEADDAPPGEFAVLLAASSDPRHVFKSLAHLKRLSTLDIDPGRHSLRIHTNDLVAQVLARQVLLFAFLVEAALKDCDGTWDYAVPQSVADASPMSPHVIYFGMSYAFLAAHNFSYAQWAVFSAALERNIAAASSAEGWEKAYGGRLAMDDHTRVAVREEWKRWRRKRKLSDVAREWGEQVILGGQSPLEAMLGAIRAGGASGGLQGILGESSPEGMRTKLEEMGMSADAIDMMGLDGSGGGNLNKPEWFGSERSLSISTSRGTAEGGPGSKTSLARRVILALWQANEDGEEGPAQVATAALAQELESGMESGLDAWSDEQIHALFIEHVPGVWIPSCSQHAFSHIPRIRAEAEFCERTSCVLPADGVEVFPHDVATATAEEIIGMFLFNPSFDMPVWIEGHKVESTSLDPFGFAAGELIPDSCEGTIAWIAINTLQNFSELLGRTMVVPGNAATGSKERNESMEIPKVSLSLTFSVGDMFDVMGRSQPETYDRILLSNVPDYTGWGPVFTLASPLLKRSKQSVLSGDCLKNPPVFPSFQVLFESMTAVPWPWTAARHGLNVIWGIKPVTDTIAIGTTSGIANGVVKPSEALSELARLVARSLYVKPPQAMGVAAVALEIISSSSSALALWALIARGEVPLHKVREWLANVVESGRVTLDCADPVLRVESAKPFESAPGRSLIVAPILADFAYAVDQMLGKANPCADILPSAFVTLKLQKSGGAGLGWCRQQHDDPALQICLLMSSEARTVQSEAKRLLMGVDLGKCVRRGVVAVAKNSDLVYHVWTAAFRMNWNQTDLAFFRRIEVELTVPVELGNKLREVGEDARWFGIGAVDHGHLSRLELV